MSLHDIFKQYQDDVQFVMIYIQEAHPVDGWWLGGGLAGWLMKLLRLKASTEIHQAKTIEERQRAAGQCETALSYGVRTYVDTIDDAVNKAYAAWPTRLYLIDKEGVVNYAGALGPGGFKPKEFSKAIQSHLASRK